MAMNKCIVVLASAILTISCTSGPRETPGAAKESAASGSIVRLDPLFDELVPKDARIEKLAGGFKFIEGPLWRPNGVLWFSDVVGNLVRQWSPDGTVTEILNPGGYDGNALPPGGFIGPNGQTADRDGGVLLCQHGNRRIVRIGPDRRVTTVVDKFEGKKLNSPNDLVYRSDGSLFFTDPPYGLPKGDDDPAKELIFNGVYKLANRKLQVIIKDLTRPNGIAFAPDEKTLYVANSDEKRRIWMRYDVAPDGTVSNGRVLADVTAEKEEGLPDGMKVDSKGNIYATGPGGVWVFSPDGKHMGTIKPPEVPANCGWGDDGKSLYMTARTGLYRIKLAAAGQKQLYQ
ncbi:MAG TPA: SMP-30/gluconolactonase/LRE family protein [Bryobacteraceae bacterium]|nr:SMP-30/gluconolactonase/LRE family protein [Bryobacteraceae bacterium]